MKNKKQVDGFECAGLKCSREEANVFLHNGRSEAVQSDFRSRVKERFPFEKARILHQVNSIIADIKRCNPVVLLMHCRIRFIGGMGISKQTGVWEECEECKARALEYIQNIIVTHKCEWSTNDDPWEMRQRCEKVIEATENLYMEILGFSLYYYHIAEQITDDRGLQNFIFGSQMMYLVRGKRDVHFNERYFSLLFKYHEDAFQQMFHLPARQVLEGVLKLIRVLCNEKLSLFAVHQLEVAKFLSLGDQSGAGWEEAKKAHEVFWTQAEDIECFNVRKITGWTDELLESLALPLGTIDETITHDYQFWPFDDFVIKDRPFLKIGSEYYCFDHYNFSDNIYRSLFKIFKENDTKDLWKSGQKSASEGAVCEVFSRLLPGCKQLKNVRYFLRGDKGRPQELDLVVLCSGMLIIVEAKGIWLRHASPIVDLKATREFYKNGLAKAGEQSRRFQTHLEEMGGIEFFDEHNQLVFASNRNDLGVLCRMCVTIDNANDITASTAKLSEVGVDAEGLICIALDDLLIYERFFISPMVFMAYLRQRHKATFMMNLSASDELDHLGIFINNPNYCNYVQEQAKGSNSKDIHILIDDNRRELDDFFTSLSDPSVKSPSLYMPKPIADILEWIWHGAIANKCELAVFLVCLDKNRKDWMVAIVEEELEAQRQRKKQHLRACPGDPKVAADGFCVCINTQWGERINSQEIRWRIKSMMVKCNEAQRKLLRLEYDPSGALVDASITTVTMADVEDIPLETVDAAIATINSRVVKRYMESHSVIGRNDPCPCQSGKKYKKCCGRVVV